MMKNIIKRCFFLLPIFAVQFHTVCAQGDFLDIDKKIQRAAAKDSLPGLALAFVNAKGLVHSTDIGYADIARARLYSDNTIQPVGSVSKMILAIAVMKAVEIGYFTLETDINEILPFKVINPYEPGHIITIRELATHTSGIIDNADIYPNTYRFNFKVKPYTRGLIESIPQLIYKQKINDTTLKDFCFNYLAQSGKYYSSENFVATPGKRTYVYCNIGTALLGYIIEIKSGMAYSAFTKKHILEPLHMNHSGWFLADIKLDDYALPYFNSQLNFPLFDLLTYPDGGFKTSAADLSKFLTDVIKGLSGNSVILKAKSFETIFTPKFSTFNLPARLNLTKRNKGILWNIYTNGTIGHDGDDPGLSAFLLFNPITQSGGLFLANKYLDDKSSLTDIITEVISKKL